MRKASAPRDLLRTADLDARGLRHVLRLAAAMKSAPAEWSGSLAAQTVACVCPRVAAPPQLAFEAAVHRLGALPLRVQAPSAAEGLTETARVLSGYCVAVAMYGVDQADVEVYAQASGVPVIAMQTELHQPCQALADLLTLRERFGRLDGLRLAFVGRAGSAANSLIEGCALSGIAVAVATPAGAEPDPGVLADAQRCAGRYGERVEVTHDPRAAVAGADVVYTAPWAAGRAPPGDDPQLARYRVDRALMRAAGRQAVFMHPLPARRDAEVTAEVIDGPRSLVIPQAHNRLPAEQALLHTLATGDWGP
ncbi:MAG TPA: ornithine carbamoyltransferase [Solirubrobacteraceae bacterium]|nr:ornithine carbamoyltransferase [Solirubrobacteraceae bacterium]